MDDLIVRDPIPADARDTHMSFPQGRGWPHQPLGRVTLDDGRSAWAVTGHALARELLADSRLSCDRAQPGFPALSEQFAEVRARGVPLVSFDDPELNAQRRLLIPHFTLQRNASMRPRIQRIVDQLLDSMERQGPPAELVSAFALPMPSMMICALLDVPDSDHKTFEGCSELEQYMGELIDHKRREPGEGLLDDLMHLDTPAGPLSRDELIALSGMLLAAHETTAGMISLGAFTLLRHPEQLTALQAKDTTMDVVAEELLRQLPVPDGMLRVAVEDIAVAGHTIRSGEGIILLGVHQCLGQKLARVELEIALGCLFERLPGLRLAVPAEEIRCKPATSTVQGLVELPVAW
ncbi:cytochrome P450 [Streptomyces rectiviolaceus]|uniref:Cytochrome P450 n=1 Tax=Streptomyces rectiviolaceus TaxID=332591 RepID=A0ABP6NPD7_9ACTN